MKNIKLIVLSAAICSLLASCGMNTAKNTTATTAPRATASTNVSDTNNGRIEEDSKTNNNTTNTAGDMAQNVGDTAGDIARDAGDAVGDAANGVGNVASDAINGASDAVGMNDANNNGR